MAVSKWRTWLQLFRAPNLFTVPGYPLAGYLLAAGTLRLDVAAAIGASLCFYSGGLLLNDLADLEEDRRERPARPLPSGQAKVSSVRVACSVLMIAGLVLCATGGKLAVLFGLALAAAIAAYNLLTKNVPGLGALNMGLCRGLSLLLGAAFVGEFSYGVLAAAGAVTLYIAAVTHLARYETREAVPQVAIWLPLAALVAGLLAFLPYGQFPSVFFAALAIGTVLMTTKRIAHRAPLPPQIGRLIGVLLLLQAAFCAGAGAGGKGVSAAVLLLALEPLRRLAARRFYAS